MKKVIMGIIDIFHLFVFFVVLLAGYFVPPNYYAVYLLLLPIIVMDWNDGDGLCWLTKLRNMVKYESVSPKVKDESENNFINSLFRKIGIVIPYKTFNVIFYLLLCVNWLYVFINLLNVKNISLFPNDYIKYWLYFMVTGWLITTVSGIKNI